jgi:hypothetical protein
MRILPTTLLKLGAIYQLQDEGKTMRAGKNRPTLEEPILSMARLGHSKRIPEGGKKESVL